MSVLGLYAEAPELRNVMPNSWRKVTKLTVNEERRFINENKVLFDMMKTVLTDSNERANNALPDPNFFFIYMQTTGNDIFFRIICTDIETPQFLSPQVCFVQFLVYKNRLVCSGYYNIAHFAMDVHNIFESIDVIIYKDTVKGVLLGSVLYNKSDYLKKQMKGFTTCSYLFMDDLIKNINSKNTYLVENCQYIQIKASDCLVDPNIPLRYSLQNAFDGNPATSYVENTENDLMDISATGYFKTKKVAIINGYAQDTAMYRNNNRVKTIELYSYTSNKYYNLGLVDNILGWQFIETDDKGFSVREIYRGEKYNDTCIAEFNIYTEEYGWLFGDINE